MVRKNFHALNDNVFNNIFVSCRWQVIVSLVSVLAGLVGKLFLFVISLYLIFHSFRKYSFDTGSLRSFHYLFNWITCNCMLHVLSRRNALLWYLDGKILN